MIEEIQYIQNGLQNLQFDILQLINLPLEELRKMRIQELEAYLYGAKLIARSCNHKSHQDQPTIQQLLAQLPSQFQHNSLEETVHEHNKPT
jgi:hypothetical protein